MLKLALGIVVGLGIAAGSSAPQAQKEDPALAALCKRWKSSSAPISLRVLRRQQAKQFDSAREDTIHTWIGMRVLACGPSPSHSLADDDPND